MIFCMQALKEQTVNGTKIWWMRALRNKALYFWRGEISVFQISPSRFSKDDHFLYYVLTYVNTNVTLSVLMSNGKFSVKKLWRKELQCFSALWLAHTRGLVEGTCFGDQSPSVYSYFASKFLSQGPHFWSLRLVSRTKLVWFLGLVAGTNRHTNRSIF